MPDAFTKYCHACAATIDARAEICPKCGVRQGRFAATNEDARRYASTKLAAGLCAVFVGALGVHKFVLGLTRPGVIMLLATVLTCGIGSIITSIVGLVEGIIYLSKSDEEFYETYIVNKKEWF